MTGKNTGNCEKYCMCKKKMRPRNNAKYLRFEGRLSFTNTVQNDKNTGKSLGTKGKVWENHKQLPDSFKTLLFLSTFNKIFDDDENDDEFNGKLLSSDVCIRRSCS